MTLRFTAKCAEMQKFQVERDMNRQLKLLFDRNAINIPFAQVVVHEAQRAVASVPDNADETKNFIDQQRELSRGIDAEEKG